jgi:hypothetical protein
MLFVKGHGVSFVLLDGKRIDVQKSKGMLHDPTGQDWPKKSVLFASYRRGTEPPSKEDFEGAPKNYLGRNYNPRQGSMTLPARDLDAWKEVGAVKTIFYVRTGSRAPGLYRHTFGKGDPLHRLVKGDGPMPILYRRSNDFRLELTKKATLDDRGYVWP